MKGHMNRFYWVSLMTMLLSLFGIAMPASARLAVAPITLSGRVLGYDLASSQWIQTPNFHVVILKAGVTWNNYQGAMLINGSPCGNRGNVVGSMEIVQNQVLEIVRTRADGYFYTSMPLKAGATYAIALEGLRYLQTYYIVPRAASGVQYVGVLKTDYSECAGASDPAGSSPSTVKLLGEVSGEDVRRIDYLGSLAGAKLTFLKLGVTPRSYTGRSRDVREVTYTDREGMFSTRNSFSKDSTYYVRLEAAGYIPVWIMFTPSIQSDYVSASTAGQVRVWGFSLMRR